MRVELAGYNVDTAVLAEARAAGVDGATLTPEPLSAAYARISRFDKPVDELRRVARTEVAKARRSNQRIIWEMGHHSVAEHAVFNFDLIGLSRLAIEAVEHFRLCSFTEKSQRYITLDGDFVVPDEIAGHPLESSFRQLVEEQNALYRRIYQTVLDRLEAANPEAASDSGAVRLLEGQAKEDARYVTALATEGQLGLTVNARNLELMIRRLAAHQLAEVRHLATLLYEAVSAVAPSLVLFVEPCELDQATYPRLTQLAIQHAPAAEDGSDAMPGCAARQSLDNGTVQLVAATEDADQRLVSAVLHTVTGRSYPECYNRARRMSLSTMRDFIRGAMLNMELYDSVIREFEHCQCTFELSLSAACFGQLKRHRMMTLTCQPYDPGLGITVPHAVAEAGLAEPLEELAAKSESLARQIGEHAKAAAPYALMNAHRRRVLVTVSARELYHISRLREDHHAQWDIRLLAAEIIRQAKQAMPLSLMLSGGKDAYAARYEELFGHPPKVVEPTLPNE